MPQPERRPRTKLSEWKTVGEPYIRFGLPPPCGDSIHVFTRRKEPGVSVYASAYDWHSETYRLRDETHRVRGAFVFTVYAGRKAYLVTGDRLRDLGSEREPLLRGVRILGRLNYDADANVFRLRRYGEPHVPL